MATAQPRVLDKAASDQKAHRNNFRNMLIEGDNKLALATLLEQFRNKVEVVTFASRENDLILDCFCVRRGTGVVCPTPPLPASGEGALGTSDGVGERVWSGFEGAASTNLPPLTGGLEGGNSVCIVPIERIKSGDQVFAHDGAAHRVLSTFCKSYTGQMIALRHAQTPATLWLTTDHRVLAKLRPRMLGGELDWSAVPITHVKRSRELRHNQTPAERRLWARLRSRQLGWKFRRQHPIGPYIADFYSHDAGLVVEIDGDTHGTPEAQRYDAERDRHMRALGLEVLRFANADILHNLEAVVSTIWQECQQRQMTLSEAEWVRADQLRPRDLVFYRPERVAVRITAVEVQRVEHEEIYDLHVEGAHSFLTDVCIVHNCGCGIETPRFDRSQSEG